MRESELSPIEYAQILKAQFYLKKYIEELKFHFSLKDYQILKIFENEIKTLKAKNTALKWFHFLNRE